MDTAIKKTNERLNFLSQDKEFLHRANLRAIALSDYTTAMNDAKDEGKKEERLKNAISLLDVLDINIIAERFNLTSDEIETLKELM